MTEPADRRGDPVTTARALTKSLDALSARLEALTSYGLHNRRMIRGLVVSLALDVVLTVVVTYVAFQAQHASDNATRARAQQVTACQSGNAARAVQIQLWDYILALPPTHTLTAAEIKQRADLKTYLHKVFVPRDCTRI